MIHDSEDDVLEAREPTPAQAEVIELLDLDREHRHLVRLSLRQWRQVDRVVDRLVGAG